jgi:hypothetical protein
MLKAEGKMTSIYVLGVVTGLLAAILGHLVAFWRLKWKTMEGRRTDWEKLRRPIYAEVLNILCALEKCQYQDNDLGKAITGLKEWLPSRATYMPPQGNDLLFGVLNSGMEFWIVSQNTDSAMTVKVNKIFNENLHKTIAFFMNNEAIRWLQIV